MSGATATKVRIVKCPKCSRFLAESADVPVYRCGGCNAMLRSKYYAAPPSENSQNSLQVLPLVNGAASSEDSNGAEQSSKSKSVGAIIDCYNEKRESTRHKASIVLEIHRDTKLGEEIEGLGAPAEDQGSHPKPDSCVAAACDGNENNNDSGQVGGGLQDEDWNGVEQSERSPPCYGKSKPVDAIDCRYEKRESMRHEPSIAPSIPQDTKMGDEIEDLGASAVDQGSLPKPDSCVAAAYDGNDNNKDSGQVGGLHDEYWNGVEQSERSSYSMRHEPSIAPSIQQYTKLGEEIEGLGASAEDDQGSRVKLDSCVSAAYNGEENNKDSGQVGGHEDEDWNGVEQSDSSSPCYGKSKPVDAIDCHFEKRESISPESSIAPSIQQDTKLGEEIEGLGMPAGDQGSRAKIVHSTYDGEENNKDSGQVGGLHDEEGDTKSGNLFASVENQMQDTELQLVPLEQKTQGIKSCELGSSSSRIEKKPWPRRGVSLDSEDFHSARNLALPSDSAFGSSSASFREQLKNDRHKELVTKVDEIRYKLDELLSSAKGSGGMSPSCDSPYVRAVKPPPLFGARPYTKCLHPPPGQDDDLSDSEIAARGFMNPRPPKERKKRPVVKRHCLPAMRGAPFVICSRCSSLLQLPSDFLVQSRRRLNKLRCGACSKVLVFSFCDRPPAIPSTPLETEHPPTEASFLSRCSDVGPELDPTSFSDDYGEPSYSTEAEAQVKEPLAGERDQRKQLIRSPLHGLMGYGSARQLLCQPDDVDDES